MFSRVVVPFYVSTSTGVSCGSAFSLTFDSVVFFWNSSKSYSNRYVVVSHCCFNLHFHNDKWCSAFFICLFAILTSSWWSVCSDLLLILKFGLVFSLLLSFKSSVYILDTSPLSDMWYVCVLPSLQLVVVFFSSFS